MNKKVLDYTLSKILAENNRFVLYDGLDKEGKACCIKISGPRYTEITDPDQIRNDHAINSKISSPFILKQQRLIKNRGNYIIICNITSGVTIKEYIENQTKTINRKRIIKNLELAINLCKSLINLHSKGYIHFNFSSDNILRLPNNTVQIIDLQHCSPIHNISSTHNSHSLRNINISHLSPELTEIIGSTPDQKTDYYSLGVILYALFTGDLPFSGRNKREWYHNHIAKVPVAPSLKNKHLPHEVSNVIEKMLSKDTKTRYQSGIGILKDLEQCYSELSKNKSIDYFIPGLFDTNESFSLSKELYGRTDEIKTLENCIFQHQNHSSFIYLGGRKGSGRSSLIARISPLVFESNGLLCRSSFLLAKEKQAYTGIFEVIKTAIKQLLSEDEDQINTIRKSINETLGSNLNVLIEQIPELKIFLLEDYVSPSTLPAEEATFRFNDSVIRLFQVLALFYKPLLLVFDYFDQIDNDSLRLLQLLSETEFNINILGIYNTFDQSEPEQIKAIQNTINKSRSRQTSIILSPLTPKDIHHLISDSFKLDNRLAHELTDIVSLKTNCNPFFVHSFLETLHKEKILYYNAHEGKWKVNILRAQEQQIADNLLDVLKNRFNQLPQHIKKLLQHAALIGYEFDIKMLQVSIDSDSVSTIKMLDTAKDNRLINAITNTLPDSGVLVSQKTGYKFAHSYIHQLILQTITKDDQHSIHYKLGKELLRAYEGKKLNSSLTNVVKHLNACSEILSLEEKKKLVKLNLVAGKDSMQHGGFEYALDILTKGYELLNITIWQEDLDFAFDYYATLTEVHAICCNYQQMEEFKQIAISQNISKIQRARLYEIEISACFAQHRIDLAVERGLEALKILGHEISKKTSQFKIIFSLLKYRNIKIPTKKLSNKDIPEDYLLAIRIISKILSASFYINKNLFPLLVIRSLVLSQKTGISQYTPVAATTLGLIWQSLGFYTKGERYGTLGMRLFDSLESEEQWAKSACIYHSGSIWHLPIQESINGFFKASESGTKTGDIEFTSAPIAAGLTYSFYGGIPLNDLKTTIEKYSSTLDRYNVKVPNRQTKILQQTIEFLQINTNAPHKLIGTFFNETKVIEHLHEIKDDTSLHHLYVNKLILAYLFNFNKEAEEYAAICRRTENEAKGIYNGVMSCFYETLLLIRLNEAGWKLTSPSVRQRIKKNIRLFRKWSKLNPHNFSQKYYLLKAEQARIKGKHAQCSELYYKAIQFSEQHQFLNDLALSNELAAHFWLKNKRLDFAKMYFQRAIEIYRLWGSNLKAELVMEQLERLPVRDEFNAASELNSSPLNNKSNIDVHTVLELTNTFSSEIRYSKLVKKSLTAILEHAGAQHGVLLLYDEDKQLKPIAKGSVNFNRIEVSLKNISEVTSYPASAINYVKNSKEVLVVNNIEHSLNFTNDIYIRSNSVKSLMAVPIIHQLKLSGVLYLENNLANNVFNKSRTELISTLCSQLAISIENATMFNTLEEKIKERTKELTQKSLQLQAQNTEIESAHQELKVLNTTKDKFLSIIGHDLRGPIGGANNLLGLALTEMNQGNYNNLLGYIQQANKTLGETFKLLNDLLLWAKSQREDIRYSPEQHKVRAIVSANINLLDHRIHQKKVTVVNNVEEDLMAYFDSHQIDIVIRNLIDNALKYVRSGDKITIESRISNNKVVISVIDTGIGIPPETTKNLFYLSGRDTSRIGTQGEKGSGLGLILCKEFVEKNCGEIWVKSTLNKGTTFHFSLPLIRAK